MHGCLLKTKWIREVMHPAWRRSMRVQLFTVFPFPSCSLIQSHRPRSFTPLTCLHLCTTKVCDSNTWFHSPGIESGSSPVPLYPASTLLSKLWVQGSLSHNFLHSDQRLGRMFLILSAKLRRCMEKRKSIDTETIWVNKRKEGWAGWCAPLIPVLGKQAELWEIQISLASVPSSSPARATNPSQERKENKSKTDGLEEASGLLLQVQHFPRFPWDLKTAGRGICLGWMPTPAFKT